MADVVFSVGEPHGRWSAGLVIGSTLLPREEDRSVELSQNSRETVRVDVAADTASQTTGAPYDPRADAIYFAVVPQNNEAPSPALPGVWKAGAWDPNGPPWVATIVVGPGAWVIAQGNWDLWVMIVDPADQPVLKAGVLSVV